MLRSPSQRWMRQKPRQVGVLASVSEERTGYHSVYTQGRWKQGIDFLDVGVCKKVNSRKAQKNRNLEARIL